MKHSTIGGVLALGLAAFSLSVIPIPATAQQPAIQRKVLLTQDLPIPGYQTVMVAIEVPGGAREDRHTHPGALFLYALEGTFTVQCEGKPTMTYKAGDTAYIEAGKIHAGINNGTSPFKAIATLVVEKGKPLSSPAP